LLVQTDRALCALNTGLVLSFMRYLALCTDYDGTLATEGRVLPATVDALERLIASGRRPILVTGRELDDLKSVCPRLDLFAYVVAENGALLYEPASQTETPIAERPPDSFVAALHARGVGPISVGRVIVATWEPHETAVLETIRDLGLELQVIFNKGAVMVLPAGVNKATGLRVALEKLGLSAHNAVGVGDAENDHALLALCECGVAVANALPTLKAAADFVTREQRGAGVVELINGLLTDDLAAQESRLTRHHIPLGWDAADREIRIPPYGENLLLMGPTGSGKSTLANGLLRRLVERDYTFCVIDTEGIYEDLPESVALGTTDRPPSAEEVLKLFRDPDQNGAINLAGLPGAQKQSFLHALLPQLAKLRTRMGRPHWLVIDAANNGVSTWAQTAAATSRGTLYVTDRPGLMAAPVLAGIDLVVATGINPQGMIEEFCQVSGAAVPRMDPVRLQPGEALAWRPRLGHCTPFRLRTAPSPAATGTRAVHGLRART
jgi:hydroxymethylpyrimidine pyrophosphatase-like HAD family hydrolase